MPHIAFHIVLKPGSGPDYDRLHDPVPADVLDQIAGATVSRYQIFRDGEDVFGYLDAADLDRFNLAMNETPETADYVTWASEVRALFVRAHMDELTGFIRPLPEVFSFQSESEHVEHMEEE